MTNLDVSGRARRAALALGTRPRDVAAGDGAVWVAGVDPSVLVRVAT
jgi:hypothetical protein